MDDPVCEACLVVATSDGENEVVFRCQLPFAHMGPHQQLVKRDSDEFTVTWWPGVVGNKLPADEITIPLGDEHDDSND